MNTSPSYVVFTALDGTLFDHHTYAWQPALSAIRQLQSLNIPIIINTSKTAAEVIPIQKELGISAPFIVENGSALYIPQGHYDEQLKHNIKAKLQGDFYCLLFGAERDDIIQKLYKERAAQNLKFSGYTDWDTAQLMQHTGLDKTSAEHSLSRQYSEPIIWQGSQAAHDKFTDFITQQGLKILRGGRFQHILGNTNKAKPMHFFRSQLYPEPETKFICLGDTRNDIAMLEFADIAVCIRSPACDYPQLKHKQIYRSKKFGPEGWQEAIEHILMHNGKI